MSPVMPVSRFMEDAWSFDRVAAGRPIAHIAAELGRVPADRIPVGQTVPGRGTAIR